MSEYERGSVFESEDGRVFKILTVDYVNEGEHRVHYVNEEAMVGSIMKTRKVSELYIDNAERIE